MQPITKHNTLSANFWWRDPLLHIVAIGLFVFAVDKFAVGEPANEHVIVVDAKVENELIPLRNPGLVATSVMRA